MSKHTVTVISCCFNESDNLTNLYDQISSSMNSVVDVEWILLLVDDGSTDNTFAVVQQLREQHANINYLKLARNFGKEAAISAGLDHFDNADAAILIDSDLQHPPALMPELIAKWREGFDMVVAIPGERNTSKRNKVFSFLFHKLFGRLTAQDDLLNGGDFRLLDAKQVKGICLLRERSRYMKGLYGFPGGKVATVEYQEQERTAGESGFTLGRRISLAIDGITSFTTAPIRFFTVVGCSIFICALAYLVYILFGIMIHGKDVPGFASLLFSVVILNGLIMIQLGVQGEYISKLLSEVKQRPIYLVDDKASSLSDAEKVKTPNDG